jgi:glucose-6-phosphate isomerase
MKEPKVTFGPFDLAADSVTVAMFETWKDAGGRYIDLLWKALTHYAATGEYLRELAKVDEKVANAWREDHE